MKVANTLEFFVGTWLVRRTYDDHRNEDQGVFTGAAIFYRVPDEQSLSAPHVRYDETGELRLGTLSGSATRHLTYWPTDGTHVRARFLDGQPFIDLDLSEGPWRAEHQCGHDHYRIEVRARTHDIIEEQWRVRGSLKSYDASTTLIRVLEPSTTATPEQVRKRQSTLLPRRIEVATAHRTTKNQAGHR